MTIWGETPCFSMILKAVSTQTTSAFSRASRSRAIFFRSEGPADTMMPGMPRKAPKSAHTGVAE